MSIAGIKTISYPSYYKIKNMKENTYEKNYFGKINDNSRLIDINVPKQISLIDTYNIMKQVKQNMISKEESKDISSKYEVDKQQTDIKETIIDEKTTYKNKKEAKTDTEIIVKPDGSRVLIVTTDIGGMKTTMSLEISKPTDMPNESNQENNDNLENEVTEFEKLYIKCHETEETWLISF